MLDLKAIILVQFLLARRSAARSMPSCGVCLSVRLSVCHTPVLWLNG